MVLFPQWLMISTSQSFDDGSRGGSCLFNLGTRRGETVPEHLLLADPPPWWCSSPEGEAEAQRLVARGHTPVAQRLERPRCARLGTVSRN